MPDAFHGVEQRVFMGTASQGWDLTPDVGDISVGATGNYEDYYAGGVTSALRAPLKSDFSVALNAFRYGTASKGMDGIAGSLTVFPWIVVGIGNGNGGGNIIDTNSTVAAGNIAKGGQVSVQGVEVTSPADGIVSASGELPFRAGAYEAVADNANNLVAIDASADGTKTTGKTVDSTKDQVVLCIVTSAVIPDGTGGKIEVYATDGTNSGAKQAITAPAAGEVRIYELAPPSTFTGTISVGYDFTAGTGQTNSASQSIEGYGTAMERVD